MDEHVMHTYARAEDVFVGGQGAVVRTEDGREFLDFLGGIAVSALGHAHSGLTAALRDQVGRILHTSNLYRHPYTERVAEKIAHLSGLEAVFFCNSGAESVECALKIARKHHELRGHGERNGFVALEGGFHGRTLGALSVTSGDSYRRPFAPLIPGVTFVARDDEAGLARALEQRPAALILEPIQGEGGIYELGEGFVRRARRLCDETETLLIHDEVQCGSGRTGRFLCGDHYAVKPDIATLAKPIAAGLPMGVTVVSEALAETLVPGDHGSTFAGGPLVCRAALVLLEALEDGLLEQVASRGALLRHGLERLRSNFDVITEVRGRGLMLGIRLAHGAGKLQQELYARRLITNLTAGDVVRFLPPFVVTEPEIERALDIVGRALAELPIR
jgi:acetylornithine aminotransferase/acetylornithine/N-succinyldiaminopimelate aminotransferase